jgi:ribosomal protein S18 acetylase RimI-like enzyme
MVGVGGALCSWAPVRLPVRHLAGRMAVSRSSRLSCRCAGGPPPALPPAAAAGGGIVRLADAADLDALCELEDLTADGASWNRRQIEVTSHFAHTNGHCGHCRAVAASGRARPASAPADTPPCAPNPDWPSQAELSRERATVLVVDEGGGPVGWAVAWEVPFELHLMSVAVHPAHRRRGLARRLLTALFEHHRCGRAAGWLAGCTWPALVCPWSVSLSG